jgi:hypothetical protein
MQVVCICMFSMIISFHFHTSCLQILFPDRNSNSTSWGAERTLA